jgi:hypothetical protein
VSFVAITLFVASQRVLIVVSLYFVMTQSGNFWIHPLIGYVTLTLLTPWGTVLEKLAVTRLIKKFLAFYGIRRFIFPKGQSLVPILSQMNPVHTLPPYFPRLNSSVIFPSTQPPIQ